MFKDEFDITVCFSTELNATFKISDVSGVGLMIYVANRLTNEKVGTGLTHDEVIKLIEVLQSAEKYIKENK